MDKEQREKIKEVNCAIRKTNALYDKWAERYHVNHFAFIILYYLYTEGPVTQKKISTEQNIPKQTVNFTIKELTANGYVILVPSQADRREKNIILTQAGRTYASHILEPLFILEEQILKRMGDELRNSLIEASAIYSKVLEQALAEKNFQEGQE